MDQDTVLNPSLPQGLPMKQTFIKKIVAAFVATTFAFTPLIGNACTAVNVIAKDGAVVAGRPSAASRLADFSPSQMMTHGDAAMSGSR
jgi:hypothetical protein